MPTVEAEFFEEMATLLAWADDVARLEVMANADTPRGRGPRSRIRRHGHRPVPHRAHVQRHRPPADRAGNDPGGNAEERQAALDQLLPIQRADFKGIFKAMAGLPVTVRLLDPPMHEFLPTASQLEFEIAHLRHLRRADAVGRGTAGHAEAARSQNCRAITSTVSASCSVACSSTARRQRGDAALAAERGDAEEGARCSPK